MLCMSRRLALYKATYSLEFVSVHTHQYPILCQLHNKFLGCFPSKYCPIQMLLNFCAKWELVSIKAGLAYAWYFLASINYCEGIGFFNKVWKLALSSVAVVTSSPVRNSPWRAKVVAPGCLIPLSLV